MIYTFNFVNQFSLTDLTLTLKTNQPSLIFSFALNSSLSLSLYIYTEMLQERSYYEQESETKKFCWWES
jgi:hypothetical protein